MFEGPEVELQKEIVDKLEKEISKGEHPEWDKMILYLGNVELNEPVTDQLEDVFKQAKMVNSQDNAIVPQKGPSKGWFEGYPLVQATGQEDKIIFNTLRTMQAAGQLAYLKESGLINDKWKVVIEIHYYRERAKNSHVFHKDTLGQTLFVNLNYNTTQTIAGPEFLVNPPVVEEHELQIADTLPPVFMADLNQVRKNMAEPEKIETVKVPAYGVVAFVDEAIHHMTPKVGHRTANPHNIKIAMDRYYKDDYDRAKSAYEKYKGQWISWYKFEDYLPKDLQSQASMWVELIEMTKAPEKTEFDRHEFKKIGVPPQMINDFLITGNSGYSKVSIPARKVLGMESPKNTESIKSDLDSRRKMLTRRMSMWADSRELPSMGGTEKRSFFRTWVRAVRR